MGRKYALCVDLDGDTGPRPYGITGFIVYVHGVSGAPVTTLNYRTSGVSSVKMEVYICEKCKEFATSMYGFLSS